MPKTLRSSAIRSKNGRAVHAVPECGGAGVQFVLVYGGVTWCWTCCSPSPVAVDGIPVETRRRPVGPGEILPGRLGFADALPRSGSNSGPALTPPLSGW